MPPKVKKTEQEILDAALQLTREKGWSSITARDLAKRLNCSTQPIFHTFQNMEELKKKVYQRVSEEYNSYMLSGLNDTNAFKGMGLAYIRFAKEEQHLFQLLFMTNEFNADSLSEIVDNDKDNDEVLSLISSVSGLSKELAHQAFLNLWLTTHGIASMIATNSFHYTEEEISNILDLSYQSIISYLKLKEEHHESTK